MNEITEYFVFLALVLTLGFISFMIMAAIHSWRVGPLVDDEPEIVDDEPEIVESSYWKKGIPEFEGVYLGHFMYRDEKVYGECAITAEGKARCMGEEIDIFFGWLDYPKFPQELLDKEDEKTSCD